MRDCQWLQPHEPALERDRLKFHLRVVLLESQVGHANILHVICLKTSPHKVRFGKVSPAGPR